ncbi:hypothetical protein CQW23_12230 [Capsicum baccatum]|uniref:Protein FAR1-RELATED SEQUENCE n=1 Tax=Capsicum baccatum TaxID=33114 RepID=A0A2G2WS51_CAPBA|nr:hypothetical protein CQW23_12230 [Capsicum baccatum]
MNRSHPSVKDEDLSVSDGEEDHYGRMMLKKRKAQCMMIATPKSNIRQALLKKSAKKLAGQLKYVIFGCDKCRKTTVRNQSNRVDCKARVNCQVMNDGLCIVTKVILEHNHELEPALSHFLPSHRTWLTAMGKIPPTAILTDQCESIKAVIHDVLPNTVHRDLMAYHQRRQISSSHANFLLKADTILVPYHDFDATSPASSKLLLKLQLPG